MANVCCPTCGCPQHGTWNQQQIGPQQWAGPAWGGPMMGPPTWCSPMMQGPGMGYGPGWAPGPAMGYGPTPGYAPPYYGALPSDGEIEEMIYDAIDADPLIPFDADIDVSVEAGTVYLRGEVPSKRIKHAAGDDSWWIPGVVDVHNDVKVVLKRRERGEQPVQTGQQG